jgi:hypothetical protein
MISLTRSEAEYVLGVSPTHEHSALEPAPLKDGTYVLPEDILDDEANADVHDFLVDHVVPGDPAPEQVWDFGTMEEPNQIEIDAYNAAKLTWSETTSSRASPDRQAEVIAKHGSQQKRISPAEQKRIGLSERRKPK